MVRVERASCDVTPFSLTALPAVSRNLSQLHGQGTAPNEAELIVSRRCGSYVNNGLACLRERQTRATATPTNSVGNRVDKVRRQRGRHTTRWTDAQTNSVLNGQGVSPPEGKRGSDRWVTFPLRAAIIMWIEGLGEGCFFEVWHWEAQDRGGITRQKRNMKWLKLKLGLKSHLEMEMIGVSNSSGTTPLDVLKVILDFVMPRSGRAPKTSQDHGEKSSLPRIVVVLLDK